MKSRKKQKDRAGIALIAVTLAAFIGILVVCAHIDAQNGISVSQSLRNWGF